MAWPLLLVAALALTLGGWRYAISNDVDAAWVVAVGTLLLGAWSALEIQRLSGQRRSQDPWPGDDDSGRDSDSSSG